MASSEDCGCNPSDPTILPPGAVISIDIFGNTYYTLPNGTVVLYIPASPGPGPQPPDPNPCNCPDFSVIGTLNRIVVTEPVPHIFKVDISPAFSPGGGSGTVTSFSSGDLSPLFTTSVATDTTTPALSFSLTAQNNNLIFAGPNGGGPLAPTFRSLVNNDLPIVNITHGGTNITTYTTGDTLYASAANTLSKLAIGSTGQVLIVAAGIPSWSTISVWNLNGNTLGNDTTWLGSIDNHDVLFKTNNTTRLTILKSGEIGFNIAPVASTIASFKGSGSSSSTYTIKAFDSSSNLNFYVQDDGTVNSRIAYWLNDQKFLHYGLALTKSSVYIGQNTGSSTTANAQLNVAVGTNALKMNQEGVRNVAIGNDVFQSIVSIGGANIDGSDNTGVGYHIAASAGFNISRANTFVGSNSWLTLVDTSNNNVSLGYDIGSATAGIAITNGNKLTFLGAATGSSAATRAKSIAIGYGASVTADNQLMIGSTDSQIINAYIGQSDTTPDANLFVGSLNLSPGINTTAGDAATINKTAGRFRKDTSGSTFVLTNSYITANSIILLQGCENTTAITATMGVSCTAGSATITFYQTLLGVLTPFAPSSNMDVNFVIIN